MAVRFSSNSRKWSQNTLNVTLLTVMMAQQKYTGTFVTDFLF